MATIRQIESARRNGARSKGPVTAEGKAKSSRNSIQHGLAADPSLVLGAEDNDNYDRLLQSYMDTYQPTAGDEYDLVCQVVSASWRLRRIGRMEANLLDDEIDRQTRHSKPDRGPVSGPSLEARAFRSLTFSGRSLDLVLRYTATARRCYDLALKTLRDLQRERNAKIQNEPGSKKDPLKSLASLSAKARRPPLPFPLWPATTASPGTLAGSNPASPIKSRAYPNLFGGLSFAAWQRCYIS